VGLAVVILVGAAAVGLARGGTLAALADLPLRGSRLVIFAVAGEVFGAGMAWATNERGWYPVGLIIAALAGFAFCARNIRLAGVPLITLGLVANALVVAVNGAMPVSTAAAARAGVSTAEITAGADARHAIAGRGTTLRALGDVVPVPLPWRPEVASPGDILVTAGLGQLVLTGMRPRRRKRRPADRNPVAVSRPPAGAGAAAVTWTRADEETPWPRRSASAGPEQRARPTTASARTADLS